MKTSCLIKLLSVISEHEDTLTAWPFFSVFLSKQIYWVGIIFGIKSETSNIKSASRMEFVEDWCGALRSLC